MVDFVLAPHEAARAGVVRVHVSPPPHVSFRCKIAACCSCLQQVARTYSRSR